MVHQQKIHIRSTDDLHVPTPLPPVGPFEFTVTGTEKNLHFYCEHLGNGVVRFGTDGTGSAQWKVDLRPEWDRET